MCSLGPQDRQNIFNREVLDNSIQAIYLEGENNNKDRLPDKQLKYAAVHHCGEK